jgi:Na+/melibiose symporter-like transporter
MNPSPIFNESDPTLTVRSLLAYGALGFPLAFAALPLYVHVPNLYAASGVLSLATLGAILWISRLADAVIDPWLGHLSDRLSQPRLLVAIAMTLLSLGLWCLLNPPNKLSQSGMLLTLWLTASLLITYFGFSLATINYQAWGASLGKNAADRLRVTSMREILGLAGVITAAMLPSLLVTSKLVDENAEALSLIGWSFILIALFCAITTIRAAPPPQLSSVDSRLTGMAATRRHVWQDKTFIQLLSVLLLSGMAAAIPATLVLFYIADLLQLPQWQGVFLALYFLTAGISLPVWNWLAGRYDKTTAWALSMGLAIFSFVWAFFLYPGAALPFALICFFSGAAFGAELAIPPALLADHLRRKSGNSTYLAGVGAYFGLWQFVNKLSLAMAAGLSLPLIAYLGYQVGAGDTAAAGAKTLSDTLSTNTPQTTSTGLTALAAVYALLPAAIKLLALLWLWRHKTNFEGASHENS